jgi:hypothetical protein
MPKIFELIDQLIAAAFDRAFGIGVLKTEKENAMTFFGDRIANERSEKLPV